jgi:predicted secreted hydrolase
LTFFREGVDLSSKNEAPWDVRDLYLAHLALSDLDSGTFLHAERANRAGPGIAGISERDGRIWNGNWQVEWRGDDQTLRAVDERFAFRLTLRSTKPPVIHGENGVSQKAAGPGRASHYVSLTHLNTAGEIQVAGKTLEVTGATWMDHEFFTHQLGADQAGWDWMSIQLQDNTELMLFRIRRKDGSIDPHSSGTFIDSRAATVHLRADEFVMEPAGTTWMSPSTRAAYPVLWKVSVPKLGLALDCSTPLRSQELVSSDGFVPAYWEGSVAFSGEKNGSPVTGVGYLEMTGYDHPIEALR